MELQLAADGQHPGAVLLRRLLYVAMTRAKERLVLSGGIHLKARAASNFLDRLLNAWSLSAKEFPAGRVPIGKTTIDVIRLKAPGALEDAPPKQKEKIAGSVPPEALALLWQERRQRYQRLQHPCPL